MINTQKSSYIKRTTKAVAIIKKVVIEKVIADKCIIAVMNL